jgi:hypothetical protein
MLVLNDIKNINPLIPLSNTLEGVLVRTSSPKNNIHTKKPTTTARTTKRVLSADNESFLKSLGLKVKRSKTQ